MIKNILLSICFVLPLLGISQNTEKINWPVEIKDDKGTILLYQPQIENYNQNMLECRSAVMVKTDEYDEGVFGAIWYKCTIATDKDNREVHFQSLEVIAAKFPELSDDLTENVSTFLEQKVENNPFTISLDRLIASIDLPSDKVNNSESLNNAPPEIIFSSKPAVLILIDGEPIYKEIEGTNYESVINTPYFLVRNTKNKLHYINGGDLWFMSEDILNNWKQTEIPPADLVEIAQQLQNENIEEENIEEAVPDSIMVVPQLFVKTNPAELLQTDDEPKLSPLNGTNLLYVSNTADNIIMDISTQDYYVLISGRWYKSKNLSTNEWTFVEPKDIPEDFKLIAEDSEMANIRSSVPGTIEAKEAVLENQIPQTAVVVRSDATLVVEYDGEPEFKVIEGTQMSYAVNTDKAVIIVDGKYYCCDNAVWFESISPKGDWIVSTEVPEEVQDIPADNPNYNVKYVYVYDSSPEVVYIGYTPGYVYSYNYYGCVYYGTGYYYNPWYRHHYYPRHCSYGYSVHYNSYSGWGFSFGYAYGSPYRWMGYGHHHHHHRAMWGPAGYRHGYNNGYKRGYYHGHKNGQNASNRPNNVQRAATNNLYSQRANGVKKSGNVKYNSKNGTRISQPVNNNARPANNQNRKKNDVYTDKSGNVYKKEGNDWKKRDNGSWQSNPSTKDKTKPAQQPQTRPSQPTQKPNNLNKDYNSRNRGNQRSQDYNQNRNNYQYQQPQRQQQTRPQTRPSTPAGGNRGGGGRRR